MNLSEFDKIIDRYNTSSSKWDVKEGELPLTVADMDFMVAKPIRDAMEERLLHPIYGYTYPDDKWYDAYISFYQDRHHLTIEKDWLVFCLGVVPTISSSVRKLTKENDHVVVMTPCYNIFFNSIVNNHRLPLEVELLFKDGRYEIDFEGLEAAFSRDDVSLFILCNPQNPIGRIYSKEELSRIGELARKHHVIVLSDEIHGEISRPGKSYVPFLLADRRNQENTVMAISVTKCFNVAGVMTSAIVIPNPELRKKVVRQINTDEVAEPNTFSCPVAIAALNSSRDWLNSMREYVFENRKIFEDFVKENLPTLSVIEGDATYLAFVDISKTGLSASEFVKGLKDKTGLIVNDGSVYGKGGEHFFRINLACPKKTLSDAMERLSQFVKGL